MNTRTADILSFLFVLASIAVAARLYPALPDEIPTHWNAAGEVDDDTSKPWGVAVLPLAAVLTWALMKIIPVISPRGFRTTEFQGVINVFQVALVGFMSLIAVLVLFAGLGRDVHIDNIVPLGVGFLFIVIGNYLGKVRKNFFIGIRTPWTLASDEVWSRTHRLGGRIFMLCGALLIAAAFLPRMPLALIGVIIVVAFVPVVYSYLLYRRLEGFSDEGGG